MDVENLARGLVAGVLVETIETRGKTMTRLLGGLSVLAIIIAVVTDGWVRGLVIVVAVFLALGALAVAIGRRLAAAAVRHVGEPAALADHRAAIDRAIDDAALPTGPIAGLKFAWRLRRGADDETRRLGDVIERLRHDLDSDSD